VENKEKLFGLAESCFKITLNKGVFTESDLLQSNDSFDLIVTDGPIVKNNKWYHKFINYITFGKYCITEYLYNVQKLNKERIKIPDFKIKLDK